MISISRILVPTVLSPSCGWAARCSERLAEQLGSKLIFVHVGSCAGDRIEAFLSLHLKSTKPDILIRQGDPAESIVQLARDLPADMIVMPTRAHGRFRRFLLGSVTAKVLHDASCPVLTGIHREDPPFKGPVNFRRLVCAVDADESFAPVIRFANELAHLLNADLRVVHAVPAADETSGNRGEVELCRYLFQRKSEIFEHLCRQACIDITIGCSGGSVQKVVRETARRENADLVIIGRGHTQQELGRLRTHAYSIIRSSPCPVVSI